MLSLVATNRALHYGTNSISSYSKRGPTVPAGSGLGEFEARRVFYNSANRLHPLFDVVNPGSEFSISLHSAPVELWAGVSISDYAFAVNLKARRPSALTITGMPCELTPAVVYEDWRVASVHIVRVGIAAGYATSLRTSPGLSCSTAAHGIHDDGC